LPGDTEIRPESSKRDGILDTAAAKTIVHMDKIKKSYRRLQTVCPPGKPGSLFRDSGLDWQ
jgi:hypothetical protein